MCVYSVNAATEKLKEGLPRAATEMKAAPDYWLMTPLIFTTLPLIRHIFRGSPHRNAIFGVAVLSGVAHGITMMMMRTGSDSEESDEYVRPDQLARAKAAAHVPAEPLK